jgi:FKBP-type peptidyl-prolyl cis-trans isomerase FkpA
MRFRSFLAALLPLTFAACLSGTEPVTYPNVPIESTTFASSLNVSLATSTKTATGLYYRDITPGTGKTVAVGDSINVIYAGYLATGNSFDDNAPPKPTFGFRIGANRVIPGFEQGVVGMKVGGTRQLILPPGLAYGTASNPGIPPNSVLVFNVQLISST